MKLIPAQSTAAREAEAIIDGVNAQIESRVKFHITGFRQFWGPGETPDARLAAMGTRAKIYHSLAKENLEHIARMAAILGGTLHDYIAPELYVPPRAFVFAEDGSGTLEPPAEGFDAWGNLIPEPEPEPEPEEEETP